MNRAPQANKNLGQHFLINQGVIAKIADAVARLSPDRAQPVIEIGPGPGALTGELLRRGHRVIAVEIDARMREHLSTEFAAFIEAKTFEVWDCDATEESYLERVAALGFRDLCVCGNLPYNVGTQILFLLLEKAPWAEGFCFMLQKEVVQRLEHQSPGSKSYGVTGIKMAWATQIDGHFWVKPGSFAPPPKVDSGVLWYRRKHGLSPTTLSPTEDLPAYVRARDIVDTAFRQRRKMLKKSIPEVPLEYATKRPDEITPTEFLNLIRTIAPGDR
ncbi:MAG TPA: 16S rRNA (adenine(1518)-N(6)/adenine(1519)-N(6))-dimethyltransferase RsmA [Bdellovibrionota bacterium]|nr:16S rRNA (adenine(1518)-N(6)/adenine(1519)-N(6))-dimethyltransferase RsmA [Bdellovibrionota bacterium]